MKYLDNSPITDAAQMPLKKGTLQFLQDSHKENLAQLLIGIIGSGYSALTPYVLWGMENSGGGSTYNISQGAVLYLGEVFECPAVSFTASGGQTAVLNIVTTQYTTDADPVTFTDAVARNVHNIRKVTVQSGVSGSGIANYSALVFGKFARPFASFAEVNTGTSQNTIVTPAGLANTNTIVHTDSGLNLRVKTIAIGDWDMDTDAAKGVAHGLSDITKVRDVAVIIFNDAANLSSPLNSYDTAGKVNGGVSLIGVTNVSLSRSVGGLYDSTDYNATSYNRGYITITYEA